jgi:uncharacterized protein (TIGR02598 family)
MNSLKSIKPRARSARRKAGGFSLTECLLAVSIAATALLGVVGMLAGAMDSARDSRLRTSAALLARQLAGEAGQMETGAEGGAGQILVVFDSAMQLTKHSLLDGDVQAIYNSGSQDNTDAWFARVERRRAPDNPLLDRVLITVEAPASAPAGQRKAVRYATVAAR